MPDNPAPNAPANPAPLTLAPKVEDWLRLFVDKLDDVRKSAPREAAKQSIALDVALTLETEADAIAQGLDQQILVSDKGALNKIRRALGVRDKMALKDKKHDADKEIDTVHEIGALASVTPDQKKQIESAIDRIATLTAKMRNARMGPDGRVTEDEAVDGEPLFSAEDIAETVWTPLVRQGIIPENAVPDAYSRVAKTFKGANAAYVERLEQYTAALDDHDTLVKRLGLASAVADSIGHLASGVVQAAGGQAAAETIVTLATVGTQGVLTGTSQVPKLMKLDIQGFAETAGSVANTFCTTLLPSEVGTIVSAAITAGLKSTAFVDKIRKGDGDGVVDALGDMFAAGFALAGKIEGDSRFIDIGAYARSAVPALSAAKDIGRAIRNDDEEALKAAAGKLIQAGIEAAAYQAKEKIYDATDATNNPSVSTTSPDVDNTNLAYAKTSLSHATETAYLNDDTPEAKAFRTAFSGAKDTIEQVREIRKDEKATPEEKKKAEEALKKALAALSEAERVQSELRSDAREFESMLLNGFSEPVDGIAAGEQEVEEAFNKIEPLILKLKKDQMVFDLIASLSTMATNIAIQFFPPAGAAGNLQQFLIEAKKAVEHARQVLHWCDNVTDARNAVSPQVDAMLNRLGLEKRQSLENAIKAALNLISGFSSIAAVGAPVAASLVAAAKIGEGALAIASKFYSEMEMRSAWNTYRAAVKSPGDRKLARQALRDNPTLAKYAIAWGALADSDPIAKRALQRCGLNDKVLADRDTHVKDVVVYLEALYAQDETLERAVTIPKDWYPGEPVLTVRSWASFVEAAEKKAALRPAPIGAVTGALVAYAKAREAFDGVKSDATRQTLRNACADLIEKLNRFEVADADGKPHKDMDDYIDQLIALAELAARDAD